MTIREVHRRARYVARPSASRIYDYAYGSTPTAFGSSIAGRLAYTVPPQNGYPFGGSVLAPTKYKYDSAGRLSENQQVSKGPSPSADTVLRVDKTYYDTVGHASPPPRHPPRNPSLRSRPKKPSR